MRNSFTITTSLAVALTIACARQAQCVEVLGNGGLEVSVSPLSWTQTETVTGMPGTPISLSEHISFANSPNDTGATPLGVFVKPRSGNIDFFDMQNKMINYTLSQTVNGTAGQNYTLTGDARLSSGYSGAVEFLDPLSPSDPGGTGTVPSPTQTTFELAFLDAGLQVIGSPVVTNLRTATTIFDDWETHTLTGAAPAGTARIRFTVAALNMVDNFGGQDVYFDNFKLVQGVQTVDRLANGNLNTPGSPANWTLTEDPAGTDTASFINFAHHPTDRAPAGQGLWLRSYEGGATPIDAVLSQTLPGTPGGNYTFSGWSRWEGGYSGGVETLDAGSPSGAIASPTETTLELAFLDGGGAVIGTPVSLDLRTQQMNDNMWRQHTLNGVAPAGTASVRVTASALDMLANIDVGGELGNQSAFFDDFSLQLPGSPGDFDGDGDVDGADFLVWQRGFGTVFDADDLADWKANFGAGAATAAVGAVPEPATAVGAAIFALVGVAFGRRRLAQRPF